MNEKIFINQKLLTAKHETANKPIPFTNNKMSTNVVRKINKTSITFPAQFDWRSQSVSLKSYDLFTHSFFYSD